MTVRPQLRLILSGDIPAPPWWSHWLFRIREEAGNAGWRILCAVLAVVATTGMRERAWQDGFALALGDRGGRRVLTCLDEHCAGNEVAWELREARGDLGGHAAAPDDIGLAHAILDYLGRATPDDRRIRGVSRLFALPAGLPSKPAGSHPEPAVPELAPGWFPLVSPRPAVVAEGRHAAPPSDGRRARSGHPQTAPRHARPRWPELVARWFRQWHRAGAHAARRSPLSTAA